MNRFSIFFALGLFISSTGMAQNKGRLQLDVEVPVKLSVGTETVQTFDYRGIITLNYPKFTLYRNPVYGINLNLLYGLGDHFKIGAGTGLNAEFFENSTAFKEEFYNMVMVPFYGKIRYQKNIKEKLSITGDLNAGYQFFDNRIGNDTSGYFFTDKGGFMGGVDIGAGYRTTTYIFSVKAGYEMNIYSHSRRLDWSYPAPITRYDIVDFKTYYNLLKITLGITIL